MTKSLSAVLVCVMLLGCGGAATDGGQSTPAAGEQWAPCGVNMQCSGGLECFGVCSFECGEKYNEAGDYGVDVASVERCTATGGTCSALAGVQINICQLRSL